MARRNAIARESANPKSSGSLSDDMHTRVRGRHPAIQGSGHGIKRLIGLSELQHQLSAQIGHYMDGEEIKVYPIDVFAKILFEKATYYQILPSLMGAISWVKSGSWGPR